MAKAMYFIGHGLRSALEDLLFGSGASVMRNIPADCV